MEISGSLISVFSESSNIYLVVSLKGDQEKQTGALQGQPHLLFGESNCGPKYGVVAGNPACTVKYMVADHGLRIISPVVTLLALTFQ